MPSPDTRSRFTAGISATWSGLRTAMRSPGVRRTYLQLVAVLFIVAALLDAVGIWAVLHCTPIDGDTSWWVTLGLWVARVIGIGVVLLVAPLLALSLVNLVFPFLGERVFLAAMEVVSPARAQQLAAQPGTPMIPAMITAVRRLLSFLFMTLVAFAVSLIPLVGQVLGPVFAGYLSARGLAWELLDPYLDKLQLDFGQQRAFVAQHRSAMVGFGLPLTFLMAIPVVGPLLFGLAQGAAATLVVDVIERPA